MLCVFWDDVDCTALNKPELTSITPHWELGHALNFVEHFGAFLIVRVISVSPVTADSVAMGSAKVGVARERCLQGDTPG